MSSGEAQQPLAPQGRWFRCTVCGRPIEPGTGVRLVGVAVRRKRWPYTGPGTLVRIATARYPARAHPRCADWWPAKVLPGVRAQSAGAGTIGSR